MSRNKDSHNRGEENEKLYRKQWTPARGTNADTRCCKKVSKGKNPEELMFQPVTSSWFSRKNLHWIRFLLFSFLGATTLATIFFQKEKIITDKRINALFYVCYRLWRSHIRIYIFTPFSWVLTKKVSQCGRVFFFFRLVHSQSNGMPLSRIISFLFSVIMINFEAFIGVNAPSRSGCNLTLLSIVVFVKPSFSLFLLSNQNLSYKLECFVGIFLTEKNRISLREKLRWLFAFLR